MFNVVTKIISIVLFVLFTTSANAGLIVTSFDGDNEGVQDSLSYEEDNVTLTITAWTVSVNSDQEVISDWSLLSGDFGVYKGSTGLGVYSSVDDGKDLDGGSSDELDDLDEGLLFSFSEEVDFLGFAGDYISGNDDVNFSKVTFNNLGEIELEDVFIDRYSSEIFYTDFIGTDFMIWVDGNDDDLRIYEAAYIKVPEPTGIFLFGLVLICLSIQRRLN